jgi:hypothetical protein
VQQPGVVGAARQTGPVTARISTSELLRLRLASQGLATERSDPRPCRSTVEVVDRLFALQGQDLPGVLWSLGLRSGDPRSAVEAAFDSGAVVRGWPFRGTLHVIAARDLPWVLALTGRRTVAGAAKRHRDLGLDDGTFDKARTVAVEALHGGRSLNRRGLFAVLEQHGIDTGSQRGSHLLWVLCLTGVLVLGPFAGGDQQVVLLDEWVREPRALGREQGLVEIVVRYLAGRGPATEADLAGWTKLPLGDLRQAIADAGDALTSLSCRGATYLAHAPTLDRLTAAQPRPVLMLPGFDELLLGYADRSVSLASAHAPQTAPGNNGMFRATVVSRGRVVGLWSRRSTAARTVVTATAFDPPFPGTVVAGLRREVDDYGRYRGQRAELAADSRPTRLPTETSLTNAPRGQTLHG